MNHFDEQNQFEKDREIVADVLADIPSVCDFMNGCDEDDFDSHERMLVDIYKFLEKKWKVQ